MKAHTLAGIDTRPAVASTLLVLAALGLYSGTADARGCGIMKPPMPAGMPMGPMHYPMPRYMAPGYYDSGYDTGAKATVISVAKRAGDFATLLTAIEAANLTALLEGDGPFTLFAPTDAAFRALPEGALQALLADKEKLIEVLKYHLVPGRVSSTDVLMSRTLKTASDQALPTSELRVIRADVKAGNGVIHVVEKVLLPAS